MNKKTPQQIAGDNLRKLIRENYQSQEEFAYDYGTDVRTISRYINNGINKVDAIQELAEFFNIPFTAFFIEN